MIAKDALAVGDIVWFRSARSQRVQRAQVSRTEETHLGVWVTCTDWAGHSWLLPLEELFPSAAAYHVHRLEVTWSDVLDGRRSLAMGPSGPHAFAEEARYYHALARLRLAQRVAALRVPVPAGGYTKTTTFEGRACYDGDAWGFEVEDAHELAFLEPRDLAPPEHAAGDMGGALWGTWTVTMTFVPGKAP